MESNSEQSDFASYLKPYLHRLLRAVAMDVEFHRAEGDKLFLRDASGRELEVLDLLGGYGSSLLGHNHPELVEVARGSLEAGRPFHAQASVRGLAGQLARRLSERVQRSTSRSYVITLASTGTEAVEAAIKHAELEMARRNEGILRGVQESLRRLRLRLRDGSAWLPPGFFTDAARKLGTQRVDRLEELSALVTQHATLALSREPAFLAVEGGFHGKSTGSLKLTYNLEFRRPWQRIGLSRVVFLPQEDLERPLQEVEANRLDYQEIDFEADGKAVLRERSISNVAACFAEPVQGEGGIRELSTGYLAALRRAADTGGFPLVFDEIQCGLGRTGTFLASEPSGVVADYYLFSKTLGGGLAKAAALLVDDGRYVPEFAFLHTSTFADDDHSSAIALRVLDLLDRDGGALMRQCRERGDALMTGLRALRERFPELLRDVRGRGLMIGVELKPTTPLGSPLLRVLNEQNLLGYVISGYLLHEHGIRVAPTLSAHGTIRLEPSAYISMASIEAFLKALGRTLQLLREGRSDRMLAFLMGEARVTERPAPERPAPAERRAPRSTPGTSAGATKVAFLAHFSEPADLQAWDTRLAAFSEKSCARFLDRTHGILQPFVVDRAEVHSARGGIVDLTVIAVPFTPEQALESLRTGSSWALDQVRAGVELARNMGCSIVGLGGYTSIVSNDCRELVEDELGLTSGNSLTAASALEVLLRAGRRLKAPPSGLRLGVVGAAGNIGAVLAELAAEEVGELVLVGRKGAARFLEPVAAAIYASELRRLRQQRPTSGLAAAMAGTRTVQALLGESGEGPGVGEAIRRGLQEELGERAPIRLATDMEALTGCQMIVSATNSARPVILPTHVGEESVVICDVAVPQDVDPSVMAKRPSAMVLRGGTVHAPLGQALHIPGLRLPPGELFGCLAETVLLGFLGQRSHFSYGRLTAARVREVGELARMHGFTIEEKPA